MRVAHHLCTARPAAALSAGRPGKIGHSQGSNVNAASARTLSTTSVLRNSNAELSKERQLGAKEETNDITTMDRLLKESRKKADSAHQSARCTRVTMYLT